MRQSIVKVISAGQSIGKVTSDGKSIGKVTSDGKSIGKVTSAGQNIGKVMMKYFSGYFCGKIRQQKQFSNFWNLMDTGIQYVYSNLELGNFNKG